MPIMSHETIVCIDDKPEELLRAQVAVEAAAYRFHGLCAPYDLRKQHWPIATIATALEGCRGVITDLFFNPFSQHGWADYKNDPPPTGLLVALYAVSHGVPAVICTDMDLGWPDVGTANSHHGFQYAWVWDFYFSHADDKNIVVDNKVKLVGHKRWDTAVALLDRF
jgi:hypothetical protein